MPASARAPKTERLSADIEMPMTYVVKQLEHALRQELDQSLRPLGITTLQCTALANLARQPGMSSAALARASFISPQAAHEMVSTLERKGLITRGVEAGNQRILLVRLTKPGWKTLVQCNEVVLELQARMLDGMSATDAAKLRKLLGKSLDNLRPDGG